MFETLPGMAMGFAMLTVVSQCTGAGDYTQARYYIKKLLAITYVLIFAVTVVTTAALPFLVDLYHLSAEATGYTTNIIWAHGIGVWIAMEIDWIFRRACFLQRYPSGKWTHAIHRS